MTKKNFCPVCGYLPKTLKTLIKDHEGKTIINYIVFCRNCSKVMNSGYKKTENEAIEAWNYICKEKKC